MKFYIAPDWMDFENPLICYTAIRAQEWDVGEAFFDYYDCEDSSCTACIRSGISSI